MKTIFKYFILVLTVLCCNGKVAAQTEFSIPDAGLTDEQVAMIKIRVAEKTAQMNDYIAFMASKKKSLSNRQYYKKKALNLFIGKGYSYTKDGVEVQGVMMETTSLSRKKSSHSLIRNYFQRVIEYKYKDVEIKTTEVPNMKVSELKQIDDNEYECTCQYDQYFIAYGDGRVILYKDKTTKRITCRITVEDTEDGIEFITQLGDVSCVCTEAI